MNAYDSINNANSSEGIQIKLCGLFRLCDADYVNEALPDYAGFVFYPPSHRNISPEFAMTLRERIDPKIQTVGVFADSQPEQIAALVQSGCIKIVQLHGHEDETYIATLRRKLPGIPIWKAFKITSSLDLEKAAGSSADRILLDGGMGSGRSFDWKLLTSINRPYILAGGLTPETIPDALTLLSPEAVDLSSGIETDRLKDRYKMISAVRAVRHFTKNSIQ